MGIRKASILSVTLGLSSAFSLAAWGGNEAQEAAKPTAPAAASDVAAQAQNGTKEGTAQAPAQDTPKEAAATPQTQAPVQEAPKETAATPQDQAQEAPKEAAAPQTQAPPLANQAPPLPAQAPTANADESPEESTKTSTKQSPRAHKKTETVKVSESSEAAESAPEPKAAKVKSTPAPKVEAPKAKNFLELVQLMEYKSAWHTMFKGEWPLSTWISSFDAVGSPIEEVTVDDRTFTVGSIAKEDDPTNDRVVGAFSSDHKKCWGLEITVPQGLPPEMSSHPKKYATLRWYGLPKTQEKKAILQYLEKDPSWK